jgi:hypothetical protein
LAPLNGIGMDRHRLKANRREFAESWLEQAAKGVRSKLILKGF